LTAALGLDPSWPVYIARGVKIKTLGEIFPAFWIGVAFLSSLVVAQAAVSKPEPVSMGNNTYSLTRSANSYFTRSTEKLKLQAREDAVQFCASQGRKMKEVSVTGEKASLIYGGFSEATIVFKALDAGDPELTSDVTTTPNDPGDLGNLIDLQKKGILSDAEFETAKKRLTDRSSDLGKLVDLQKKGVLSDADFEAAKKRLLGRSK
jgi:hypothetical protein